MTALRRAMRVQLCASIALIINVVGDVPNVQSRATQRDQDAIGSAVDSR